jgi:predicted RNase H-like HicB family nuclease
VPQNGTDCRLIHTGLDQRSGDWWAAWVEELPGANTQGTTIEEARENLREAIALMLEDEAEDEADSAPAVVGAEVLREVVTVTPA